MTSDGYGDEVASEIMPIADTYIQGVHKVEFLGRNNVRIHLFTEQDGQRVIVGKIVMAMEDVPLTLGAVMRATWHRLSHVPLMEMALASRVGTH